MLRVGKGKAFYPGKGVEHPTYPWVLVIAKSKGSCTQGHLHVWKEQRARGRRHDDKPSTVCQIRSDHDPFSSSLRNTSSVIYHYHSFPHRYVQRRCWTHVRRTRTGARTIVTGIESMYHPHYPPLLAPIRNCVSVCTRHQCPHSFVSVHSLLLLPVR